MKNKFVYIAQIETGEYSDYWISNEFASLNKEKVKKWVERFNSLIKKQKEKIENYMSNNKDNKHYKFYLHNYIIYQNPSAKITKLKLR